MWEESSCLIVKYLRAASLPNEILSRVEDTSLLEPSGETSLSAIYLEILETPSEKLASELVAFALEQDLLEDDKMTLDYEAGGLFWGAKGVDEYDIPPKVEVKKREIERVAQKQLEKKAFNRIRTEPEEEIAKELADYAKSEHGALNEDRFYISSITKYFWQNYGIDPWNNPSDVEQKKDKVVRIADKLLKEEREEIKRMQLEKEEEQLPKMVEACVEWAKKKGLKKVTKQDVELFLLEGKIEILSETNRTLYLKANDLLKSPG
jgi:hypothetical protein